MLLPYECQGRRLVPECSGAALPEALQRSCKVDSATLLPAVADGCRGRLNNVEGAEADLLTARRHCASSAGEDVARRWLRGCWAARLVAS
jgi:hypothetical protein